MSSDEFLYLLRLLSQEVRLWSNMSSLVTLVETDSVGFLPGCSLKLFSIGLVGEGGGGASAGLP